MLTLATFISACATIREQAATPEENDEEQVTEVTERDRLKSTTLLIEGAQQKMLDNPEEAIERFIEATEADPENDAAHYELAKAYAKQGDYEEALRHAQNATELSPGNKHYQMSLADIYTLKNQLDDTIRIYEALVKQNPGDIALHEELVSAYLRNDQYDNAIDVLDYIESQIGFSRQISMQKQRLLVEQGYFDRAIEEAEKLVEMFTKEEAFYEHLGELYMHTGRDEKAKATFERLLDEVPGSPSANMMLADYYRQRDQETKAFDYLKEAFRSPRMEVENKARVIFSYMQLAEENPEHMEHARDLSEILLEAHPDDPEAYMIYGDILNRNEQTREAREVYLEGARLDPSNLELWQQILNLDMRMENYNAMRDHSDQALEYFFEQPILYLFNGLANMQLEEHEAAVSSLEYGKSIVMDDEELKQEFYTMLGDSYYQLGQYDASDRHYEKALEVNPDNTTTLNNYSYHLAVRGERLKEALQMAEKAVELDPENAAFLDTYGWVHYQKGDYQKAEKWIAKALEHAEVPSADVLEHYGDVMYNLGNEEKAIEFWKKAREKGPGSDLLDKKIRDGTLYE